MEIELVNETKSMCESIYNTLRAKHAELKSEGAAVSILNEIVSDMKEAIRIHKGVKVENVEELHAQAIDLQTTIEFKYGIEEEDIPDLDEEEEEETSEEDLDEEEEEETEDKGHGAAIVWGLVTTTLLAGIAYHTGAVLMKKNESANRELPVDVVEETEEAVRVVTQAPKTTEAPETTEALEVVDSQTPETTESHEDVLVLGEYGTFFDVTDDEQVTARANYIINEYYAPFMNQLSEQERSIITVENIANVIRVMAGELPLDENGNKVMDANIVDNYGQMFTVLVGDLGSSPQLGGRYYNIPAHMFTVDGTELSNYIKGYDESYQKITDGFNKAADERLEGKEVTGGLMVREGISELGYKYWNEWVMQGIYGDVNPFNFDAKDRLFAYLSAFAKYGAYAFEYNLDSMQAVCIPVCINYETKEKNEIPVNEIFVGYASGEWNNVIAKVAGIEAKNQPDSIAFTQDLFDELNWKYNNTKQLKLN